MIFEAYTEFFDRPRPPHTSDGMRLWPSEVAGCVRAAIYRCIGYEETHPTTPAILQVMRNGVVLEAATLEILREVYGVENVLDQVRLQTEYWSGKIDFVIRDGDRTTLVEHKAINPQWWDYKGELPQIAHVLQLACYGQLWEMLYQSVPDLALVYKGWNQLGEFALFPSSTEILAIGRLGRFGEKPTTREVRISENLSSRMETLEQALWNLRATGEIPDEVAEALTTGVPQPAGACLFRGKPGCRFFGVCWR